MKLRSVVRKPFEMWVGFSAEPDEGPCCGVGFYSKDVYGPDPRLCVVVDPRHYKVVPRAKRAKGRVKK